VTEVKVGAAVTVKAEEAVIAVAALIESGMGEAAPIPATPPVPPPSVEEAPPP
jgi:hypothetical protein